ncbi:BURP domain-containing protein 3-like [Pyrus ussuriensis x Pyrus communis]|uniref:BURP domain-containing protein 3-like n=1 Tax=Pyrus ussuriensis x Pyrus communis TaxID=2448454 RepID=A0A5N5HP27_9ROSA|nr:BURP domain-containing protein 3-like [Pyrus ussuriensis x Pyrus communis]
MAFILSRIFAFFTCCMNLYLIYVGKSAESGGTATNFAGYNPQSFMAARLLFFLYNRSASRDDINRLKDPTQVVFFLEEAVRPGITMKYSFSRNTSTPAMFLPREIAESVPFSSSKLPEILNRFSLKPGSVQADIMKQTLQTCESTAIPGEQRYCATSLESLVDYATAKLGRNIQPISTELEAGAAIQNYTITPGVKLITSADKDRLIVCHKMDNGYAVFYCHGFKRTRAYSVPLQGSDGTKVKAVAICHLDTSAWNPKTYALLEVKVAPGTDSVCHFLPEGHFAWVPK